ncbi:TetR/AcrR family transcriptional regulator [Pararhizobium mangrovi]|uniref:TetR/AcrR family transcriptional regulator n=1 Tax=Pararhizobium mangrovi TaxID=2590452 RepID=A0A506U3H2_9HYPH|nr:TetR/AcrR family transcriptional regulator [Pararhizobium mangrovi]TPW27584.1 TetR/AcrR family transcriptional regulator [Pararhizobium mangrovi]
MANVSDDTMQGKGCGQRGRAGRHAAGCDPVKRDQILNGAYAVFSRMGFDAASMNDITREANVSKGTIYVYFESKEDLFEALVDRERDLLFRDMHTALEGDDSVPAKLRRFGKILTRLITSDKVIQAQRIVIGVSERMPALGASFYKKGPRQGKQLLTDFLEQQVSAGLLAIDDIDLASYQFAELCLAGLFRRRIFAEMPKPPSHAEIERNVDGALRVFLAAYATSACPNA